MSETDTQETPNALGLGVITLTASAEVVPNPEREND